MPEDIAPKPAGSGMPNNLFYLTLYFGVIILSSEFDDIVHGIQLK